MTTENLVAPTSSVIYLGESRIPNMYQQSLRSKNIDWEPTETTYIYGSVITAISEFLAEAKEKTAEGVSIIISDLKGTFKIAGIIKYHENENKDMPGNWSYVITFDEADIKGTKQYQSNDIYFQRFVSNAFFKRFNLQFNGYSLIQDMCLSCVDVLLDYLDKNASATEVKDVELEGYFKASVAIEDGVKHFSIVPDGAMKRLIKDDSASAI